MHIGTKDSPQLLHRKEVVREPYTIQISSVPEKVTASGMEGHTLSGYKPHRLLFFLFMGNSFSG